jgi:hypothetical protein
MTSTSAAESRTTTPSLSLLPALMELMELIEIIEIIEIKHPFIDKFIDKLSP